jgi:glycosyltransferase involved in cell wall biosynthesis
MKILHIGQHYSPLVSGVPFVVREISERLVRRGYEVHVATGAVTGCPKEETRNGVFVHRFDVQGNSVLGVAGETGAFLDFVRSTRWDAIAVHCAQTWSTDLLFGVELDGPVVFVAHGLSAYGDPAYRRYFSRLAEWLRREKVMVSLARTGIADAQFRRDYGLPDAVIIPNGVDTAEWNSPSLGVRQAWGRTNAPWLVNVSTHSPAKNHRGLFGLARALRGIGASAHVTQIGSGHRARKWNLGRLGVRGSCYYRCIATAPFVSNLTMKVGVSRTETVSAVKEADVFILTSSLEASPLVILEAMAAGTPFVSFDVGCIREHVGGRVVASLPEMVEATRELLSSPELRRHLGEQGRARIAERHDWEVIVTAYENLYARLIGKACVVVR